MEGEIGVHHRRVGAYFSGKAIRDLGAEVEHYDALRERQQEMHVVLDQEYRDAAGSDAADDLAEPRALCRRETRGRLGEQDQARLPGRPPRKPQQPPLPDTT